MLDRKDCILRDVMVFDLDQILEWRNSSRIRLNMFTDHEITRSEHLGWFERQKHDPKTRVKLFVYKSGPAGIVTFSEIDPDSASANWGFYLGETELPKGCGLAMGFLALNFAFEEIDLSRVHGESFSFNEASVGYHRRLGFVGAEPRFKPLLKNGKYEEIASFVLLKDAWLRRKPEIEQRIFGEVLCEPSA
ncbi:MAG: UDP-4-amino-4,6-dideoxy-N-acetyl-beta-L-altrosamine N-acetyltransferase [Bdellovibrionota bacterium]